MGKWRSNDAAFSIQCHHCNCHLRCHQAVRHSVRISSSMLSWQNLFVCMCHPHGACSVFPAMFLMPMETLPMCKTFAQPIFLKLWFVCPRMGLFFLEFNRRSSESRLAPFAKTAQGLQLRSVSSCFKR